MSLFLSSFIFIRFTRKAQRQINYTAISKSQINSWVAKNPNSVIVFADSPKILKPLKLAIDDNSEYVSFALCDPNPESNQYCISYPCASAYLKGKHIRSTISDFSPIDFQFWVSHTVSEPHFDVIHPEEIRRLMDLPGYVLFAVEMGARPNWVPKDHVLYHVTRNLLKPFQINAKPNTIYVYRNSDREFFELTSWNPLLFKSELFDIGVDNLLSTHFIGCAFVERASDETDKLKIDTMKKLSYKFSKYQIMFTTLSGSMSGHVSNAVHANNICGPLFLILQAKNITGDRWGLTEITEEYNDDVLMNFINKVLNNTKKPIIAQDTRGMKRRAGVNELSALDYERRLYNKNHTNLVILTSACNGISAEFAVTLNNAASFYFDKKVKFWAFDQGRNDQPNGLEIFSDYPKIIIYPKYSSQYKVFEKTFTIPNLAKFINVTSGVSLHTEEKEELQKIVLEELRSYMKEYGQKQSMAQEL